MWLMGVLERRAKLQYLFASLAEKRDPLPPYPWKLMLMRCGCWWGSSRLVCMKQTKHSPNFPSDLHTTQAAYTPRSLIGPSPFANCTKKIQFHLLKTQQDDWHFGIYSRWAQHLHFNSKHTGQSWQSWLLILPMDPESYKTIRLW